ncbi:MAG: hypothetical protein ABIP20_16875 [Chthoniobacteraceae bacterium]
MSNTPTLNQLQRGLQLSQQIASLEAELASIFSGSAAPGKAPVKASPATKADGRTGKRSPETIAKMKAAQQARWAKKKAPAPAAKAQVAKKKGGMSAEGRARIVAAQKLRWAKIKAENPNGAKTKASAPLAKKAPAPKAPAQKKRTISPEHRAKLVASAKARWAAAKAGKGPSPTAKK